MGDRTPLDHGDPVDLRQSQTQQFFKAKTVAQRAVPSAQDQSRQILMTPTPSSSSSSLSHRHTRFGQEGNPPSRDLFGSGSSRFSVGPYDDSLPDEIYEPIASKPHHIKATHIFLYGSPIDSELRNFGSNPIDGVVNDYTITQRKDSRTAIYVEEAFLPGVFMKIDDIGLLPDDKFVENRRIREYVARTCKGNIIGGECIENGVIFCMAEVVNGYESNAQPYPLADS
ncbi:hypothetical protein BX600DRAFT_440877 [Xylariales sp. PMI_506]|nr:hypothetical protein BX600DRAFT_440877 [Xylariales sp. PMI_506]